MSELPLRPAGHTSVMANRQPTAVDDLDFFPTPPWAARAGGEIIRQLDPDARTCWEPACGEGHMAWGLDHYFDRVIQTDVWPYGDNVSESLSFLDPDHWTPGGVDWIVTNPPFKDGEAFVRQGLRLARRGVAMLLRLVFVESAQRARLFAEHPPVIVAPFSERVPMVKGRWDPDASSATAYAWFVWRVPGGCPRPAWDFGGTRLQLIGPGARQEAEPAGGHQPVLRDCGSAAVRRRRGGCSGPEAPPGTDERRVRRVVTGVQR